MAFRILEGSVPSPSRRHKVVWTFRTTSAALGCHLPARKWVSRHGWHPWTIWMFPKSWGHGGTPNHHHHHHHSVMDDHDLVLKAMLTWGSSILGNLHMAIAAMIVFLSISKVKLLADYRSDYNLYIQIIDLHMLVHVQRNSLALVVLLNTASKALWNEYTR